MSVFGDFTKSPGFGSVVNAGSGLVGGALGFIQQNKQNAFNAQEAQKNRDWEEHMSNTAFQRQVTDMQAAGVNPALMYGGAGASGASTPSGSAASSAGFNALADAISVAKLGEELKGMKLDNSNKERTGEGIALDNEQKRQLIEWYPKLNESTVSEIASRIKVNDSAISLNLSQKELNDVNAAVREVEKEWIPKINEAKTESDKASAARNYAEAAISRYELRNKHRLGSSQAITIAASLVEALASEESQEVINGVVDGVNDALSVVDVVTGRSSEVHDKIDRIDDVIDQALGLDDVSSWQSLRGFVKQGRSYRPKLFNQFRSKE